MRKKRFSVEQIIGVLKRGVPGVICTREEETNWQDA